MKPLSLVHALRVCYDVDLVTRLHHIYVRIWAGFWHVEPPAVPRSNPHGKAGESRSVRAVTAAVLLTVAFVL